MGKRKEKLKLVSKEEMRLPGAAREFSDTLRKHPPATDRISINGQLDSLEIRLGKIKERLNEIILDRRMKKIRMAIPPVPGTPPPAAAPAPVLNSSFSADLLSGYIPGLSQQEMELAKGLCICGQKNGFYPRHTHECQVVILKAAAMLEGYRKEMIAIFNGR